MSDATLPRIEIFVEAPADVVWAALRDKEKIRHWHGWEYTEHGGLDGEIDLIFFTGVTADTAARTLEVQGGDRFVLEPEGAGTRITLTRAPHGDDPEWDAYYDEITEGWITFLHQLKFAVERQPGAVRRTLFFSGPTAQANPLIEELGLAALADRPPGTPYTATIAGEQVSGAVWFRSPHQLGLTVRNWGHDGLLVIADTAPTQARPHGAAMAILSTYALTEARYEDLQAKWTAWWTPRYPAEQQTS